MSQYTNLGTSLKGRLRNTRLPKSQGLLPLFEAVINSIHAIEETTDRFSKSSIQVTVLRSSQIALKDETTDEDLTEAEIVGFSISDNGVGFNDENFTSFKTLDSCYKEKKGCRGVGRLLWLKAFESVRVSSCFKESTGKVFKREFDFAINGISDHSKVEVTKDHPIQTTISLNNFHAKFRKHSPNSITTIAKVLLEHCLWYFIRKSGTPQIEIVDKDKNIDLHNIYKEYQISIDPAHIFDVKGESFNITHIKLLTGLSKKHKIAYSASGRLVKEESLDIPGLSGTLEDDGRSFSYMGFVSSRFFDEMVRPERTGFDINENSHTLFSDSEISFPEIREAIKIEVKDYLCEYLYRNHQKLRERLNVFVEKRSPKYRPILRRVKIEELSVSYSASDKDLDLALHKEYAKLESELIDEGHDLLCPANLDNVDEYQSKIHDYLQKAEDIKKSDLARYVSHRRVILDLLKLAVQKQSDGHYVRESLIHRLIMPMGKDSTQILSQDCNLWLIDERLAFHHYMASDKTIRSMPVSSAQETKEPDIVALNIYDNPMLFNDGDRLPLASITVIEIKKPMRNDVTPNTETDPISQSLDYLEKIRNGGAKTLTGRPIPDSEAIPGFCYVICDITKTVIKCCNKASLLPTADKMGFFGYIPHYRAYVEVLSYDRLVNAAEERNKAFFDMLGFPATE